MAWSSADGAGVKVTTVAIITVPRKYVKRSVARGGGRRGGGEGRGRRPLRFRPNAFPRRRRRGLAITRQAQSRGFVSKKKLDDAVGLGFGDVQGLIVGGEAEVGDVFAAGDGEATGFLAGGGKLDDAAVPVEGDVQAAVRSQPHSVGAARFARRGEDARLSAGRQCQGRGCACGPSPRRTKSVRPATGPGRWEIECRPRPARRPDRRPEGGRHSRWGSWAGAGGVGEEEAAVRVERLGRSDRAAGRRRLCGP